MKIIEVKTLRIPEIKVIKYARFSDQRGYFTETYRKSDFFNFPEIECLKGIEFLQCNESFSKKGTVRGLHFQWNPYQGKLVRPVFGRLVDLVLDIRKGSPVFGKILAYEMAASLDSDHGEWLWIPPGFANGTFFSEDTIIEYFCTGEWNPECEAGISPIADDIDWAWCDPRLKKEFEESYVNTNLITEKDRKGFTVRTWEKHPHSERFVY